MHPAFEGAPGHKHWKTLCERGTNGGLAAGLFSVMIDARFNQAQVDAFCDGLKLFKIGYSWGGPVSLVVPYNIATMRQTWPGHLKPGTLVRFSTGLESAKDLILDLHQAMQAHLPMA
jgi:cystathionine beta-lyase